MKRELTTLVGMKLAAAFAFSGPVMPSLKIEISDTYKQDLRGFFPVMPSLRNKYEFHRRLRFSNTGLSKFHRN